MSYQNQTKRTDYSLVISILILTIFGLVVLSSASTVIGLTDFNDSYYFLKHQLLKGVLPGLILFFVFLKTPYRLWQKYYRWALILAVLLLGLVFIPGLGATFNSNAYSWLNFGFFSFQPSEIAKLLLIIYLAGWLNNLKIGGLKNLKTGFLPFVAVLGLVGVLIALQPDLGTMVIVVLISLGIYFSAGASYYNLGLLFVVGAGLIFALIKAAPYRFRRFLVFLDPSLDPLGAGYHIQQALLAIGTGGFLGLGLGHSRQKFQYLPQVYGDSIFAVMAEELGFVLTALFVIFLIVFILRTLQLASHNQDNFVKFFAVGVAIWIGGQALINIGAMLGILPLTGVPLPFVSYGGTSVIIILTACGMLANMAKN
ncbi:MAG TPA: putative lipid II flippase FtsW [bacterium]|nr:putative lipid II flippase FtsW [bacterium]